MKIVPKDDKITVEEAIDQALKNPNKPTDEEVAQFEKDYNEAAQVFNDKIYEVGTVDDAEDVYKFFIEYLENYAFWTKNGWMGILKLHDEVTKKYEEFQKERIPFSLSYQALEFTFYMLSNPGGIGLKSAQAIELISEMYIFVMDKTSACLESARVQLKDIQFLYDKWIAAQQGFYLEKEDGVESVNDKEDETISMSGVGSLIQTD